MRLNFYQDREILECQIDGKVLDIPASCVVRNELNGRRKLHDAAEVVYAMGHDPYTRIPVMPRTFPTGHWRVYKPRARVDRYLAPFYIPTDAEQYLPVWALDDHLGYAYPDDGMVLDIGYGLHFSTSPTTVGCIRIHQERDLLWLAETINNLIDHQAIILSV
jgi:hypothetical protein